MLLFSFNFICSEELNESGDFFDYTRDYDFNVSVRGLGLEPISGGDDGASFIFPDSGGKLIIGENKFENIVSTNQTKSKLNVHSNGLIENASFIVNSKGGFYSINGIEFEAPPNSFVEYTEDGGVVIKISDGNLKTVPSVPEGEVFLIEGVNVKLPEGNKMSGVMRYGSNGQAYVIPGDSIYLEGVKIDSTKGFLPIDIYFDGAEHTGNYVSFGDNVIRAKNLDGPMFNVDTQKMEGAYFELDFLQGNNYLDIENGDSFKIVGQQGAFIFDADLRSEKIPELDVEGFVLVKNNGHFFSIEQDSDIKRWNVMSFNSGDYSTTTPIRMKFSDPNGKPVKYLDETKGRVIFVDNFNRFAISPSKKVDEFYAIDQEGLDIKFSSSVDYNYPDIEDIKLLYGDKLEINGDFSGGVNSLVFGRLRDYYDRTPVNLMNSINKLRLGDDSYFINQGMESVDIVVGFADRNGDLVLNSDSIINYETFRHEAAHLYNFKLEHESIENVFLSKYNELVELSSRKALLEENLKKEVDLSLAEKYEEEWNLVVEKISEEEDVYFELKEMMVESTKFNQEWKDVSGELPEIVNIGAGMYKQDVGVQNVDFDRPLSGLIRPYGGESHYEDVATYMEKIMHPEFFYDLIDPNSVSYDARYLEKLKLLNKYGFITKKEFDRIADISKIKN
jgi:hypothetical protein